jgi:hypothetical protein
VGPIFSDAQRAISTRTIGQVALNLAGGYADRDACVYGEHAFVFARGDSPGEAILVTVLPLPRDIRAALADARHRRP